MSPTRHTQLYYSELIHETAASADKPSCPSLYASLTRKELGVLGEDIAAAHLISQGMEIIERNYRCSEGEADIVAFDPADELVVLVEVKTRRCIQQDEIYAEESVTAQKRRRYRRIAGCYMMEHYPIPAIRFDVIGVSITPDGTYDVHYIPQAFGWDAEI
ncbi:YraN family protein [Collinsella sp. zg1085]|uniref:YraN family protein n=1 Tax=Collinsella sp. zg1085 TaxID=2844380 RepID=UPI001C0D4A86|nr:YraN family protein [Collinsella sp. zg1085]QWT17042.1 YraN family protein [Collinsella sp. zg1085]